MILIDRAVLTYVSNHPGCARSEIRRDVAPEASTSTVWRALRRLVDAGKLEVVGEGRGTRYRVAGGEAVLAHLRTPVHLRSTARYRTEFARRYRPNESHYLTETDRERLAKASAPHIVQGQAVTGLTFARRVSEELVVDMAWASSRIEGNRYSLLETASLVDSGRAPPGKSLRDTATILNHEAAIRYVVKELAEIRIGWRWLRNVHAFLSYGLLQDPTLLGDLRRAPTTIGRSTYIPIDCRSELREELDVLLSRAARIDNPFEQSFFLLVHIPYLHPFAAFNERTSRIASIIPLLKAGLAPMSFFAIDELAYRRGLLGVYELNDVSLLRQAFVDGYIAAAERYRHPRPEAIDIKRVSVLYWRFTRRAVRRCILEWRAFEPEPVREMMEDADIPLADRDEVLDFVEESFRTLTPGNAILYGVKPEALEGLEGLEFPEMTGR